MGTGYNPLLIKKRKFKCTTNKQRSQKHESQPFVSQAVLWQSVEQICPEPCKFPPLGRQDPWSPHSPSKPEEENKRFVS